MLCVEGMLAVRVAGRWRGGESPGRLAWVRVAPSSWCQGGPATVTLPCWCHCWLCWEGGTDPYRGAGPALAASGSPRLVPKPALIHILPVNSKLRVLPHSVSLLPPPPSLSQIPAASSYHRLLYGDRDEGEMSAFPQKAAG